MEEIVDEENEWDHNMTEVNVMEETFKKVTWEEMVKAIRYIKPGKTARLSRASVGMITVSGEIGIDVMMELCLCVLDGRGMQKEWKMSVIIPIGKRKGDVVSSGA